jgi:hypothetical protein
MKIHTVKRTAGVNLHARECGESTGIPNFVDSWMCAAQRGSVPRRENRPKAADDDPTLIAPVAA